MQTLIRRLWPLLKPRVTALLAAQLIALAARGSVTLSKEEAAALAAMIVTEIEALLDQDDAEPALTKAVAALARAAVEPVAVVASPTRVKIRKGGKRR